MPDLARITLRRLGVSLAAIALASCGGGGNNVRFEANDVNIPAGSASGFTFDTYPAGSLVGGMTVIAGAWSVREEVIATSKPNALCEDNGGATGGILLSDDVYDDVDVTLRYIPKPANAAAEEQLATGIIFRAQDTRHYYLLRGHEFERRVNVYLVDGGDLKLVAEGKAHPRLGQVNTFRLEAHGGDFVGYLNGMRIVIGHDETYQAGKLGLQTSKGSITCFDDVEIDVP